MKNTDNQMEPKEGIQKGPGGYTAYAVIGGRARRLGCWPEQKGAEIAIELARIGVVAPDLRKIIISESGPA